MTHETSSWSARNSATSIALSQWRSIRAGASPTLHRLPRVERRLLIPDHEAPLTGGHGERSRTEPLHEIDAERRVFTGEFVVIGVFPRERPAVDKHAADGGARPVEPLSRRLPDDVRAVFDGAAEIRSGERVVDEEGDAVVVGDFGEALEVRCDQRRVADGLTVDVGRVLVDSLGVGVVVERVDEPRLDTVARRGVRE